MRDEKRLKNGPPNSVIGKMKIAEQRKVVRDLDKEKVRKEGEMKGRKEGIEESEKKGKKEKAIEIALNLNKNNIPIEIISQTTGLPPEELEKLFS
jgi:predicted transposase/invertase (TIGR01784 family)